MTGDRGGRPHSLVTALFMSRCWRGAGQRADPSCPDGSYWSVIELLGRFGMAGSAAFRVASGCPGSSRRVEYVVDARQLSRHANFRRDQDSSRRQEPSTLLSARPRPLRVRKRMSRKRGETDLRMDFDHPAIHGPDPGVDLQDLLPEAVRLACDALPGRTEVKDRSFRMRGREQGRPDGCWKDRRLALPDQPAGQNVSLPGTSQRKADRDVDSHHLQLSVAVRSDDELVDGGAEVAAQVAGDADPALLAGIDAEHAGHESTSTINSSRSRLTQNTASLSRSTSAESRLTGLDTAGCPAARSRTRPARRPCAGPARRACRRSS